jgi:hypothetical protein
MSTELANWSALKGAVVRREEVAILRRIDKRILSALAQRQAEVAERSAV